MWLVQHLTLAEVIQADKTAVLILITKSCSVCNLFNNQSFSFLSAESFPIQAKKNAISLRHCRSEQYVICFQFIGPLILTQDKLVVLSLLFFLEMYTGVLYPEKYKLLYKNSIFKQHFYIQHGFDIHNVYFKRGPFDSDVDQIAGTVHCYGVKTWQSIQVSKK